MEMEVIDRLAAVTATIDDNAVAIREVEFRRELADYAVDVPNERFIFHR